jgi:hypothetical protein
MARYVPNRGLFYAYCRDQERIVACKEKCGTKAEAHCLRLKSPSEGGHYAWVCFREIQIRLHRQSGHTICMTGHEDGATVF